MPELGSHSLNTTRPYAIALGGPGGGAAGSSLEGLFDGTETFAARLWPGGRYATLATLSAAWDGSIPGNPAALEHPVVRLTIAASAIAGVEPGTYAVQVVINPGLDDLEAWEGSIELTAAGGSEPIPPTFCGTRDLLDLAAWAAELQDLGPGSATNFLRERALAADWVVEQALARRHRDLREQAGRHGPIAATDPIVPASGYDAGPEWGASSIPDTTLRDDLAATRALLEGGALVLDRPTVRLAALWALHLICRPQVGKEGGTPYQKLAGQYRRDALQALAGWTARLDADADGVAEMEVQP